MFREFSEQVSAVQREAGSVLLHSGNGNFPDHKSYLFQDCSKTLVARSLDEIPALYAGIEVALRDGFYVAGFLSYECGAHFEPRVPTNIPNSTSDALPLAWFGVYRSPEVLIHRTDKGKADRRDSDSVQDENENLFADIPDGPSLEITASAYRDRIERIKRYIEAGDTYQVNFTTGVQFPCSLSAAKLFSILLRNQPVAYGALINLGETQIVSASPELFFKLKNGCITSRPMKGTAARGKDKNEDAAIAAWLERDEKNRSENVMIVDLLRNDLGRICIPGSVVAEKLFEVERYRTLFQMTSTVSGQLRPDVDFYGIFRALFPCGSIVGAPKVRTMQIIHEIEDDETGARRRGVYTGAIGFISPRREAVFSVAIRTLVLRNGIAEMGVGSGIVHDSDPEAEYEECKLKAAFLARSPVDFQLIETILWDGDYFLLDLHLKRLADSVAYFDFCFDREEVLRRLSDLQSSFSTGQQYKVRLLLEESGEVQLSSVPIPQSLSKPLQVMITEERVSSTDLFLRHKTTHRDQYDRTYARVQELGYDDVLFLNERDEVTEGAIHNIFVGKDEQWLTPTLGSGVLPGIYRQYLLETNSKTVERTLTLDDFRTADRVFLCNSVRGLREVGSIRSSGELLFVRRGLDAVSIT